MGERKQFIDEQGWRLVLIFPGQDESSRIDVKSAALSEVEQISDPYCELFRSFGLGKGSLGQLFSKRVFGALLKAMKSGHRGGVLHGDGLQLAGTFLVAGQKIKKSHIARDAADIGDLDSFAENNL